MQEDLDHGPKSVFGVLGLKTCAVIPVGRLGFNVSA